MHFQGWTAPFIRCGQNHLQLHRVKAVAMWVRISPSDLMFKHVMFWELLSAVLLRSVLGLTDNCKSLFLKPKVSMPSEYIPLKAPKLCHLIIWDGRKSKNERARAKGRNETAESGIGLPENEEDALKMRRGGLGGWGGWWGFLKVCKSTPGDRANGHRRLH